MLALYLTLIQGDDQKALFTEFYEAYKGRLYSVALCILHSPALAEEAVQDACLRIINGHFEKFLDIFQNRRKEIEPWAVTITKNISLNKLTRESRSNPLPEKWDAPAAENTERADGYRRLVALIRSMPESYRRALELKFVCECSDQEIANDLDINLGAAQQRIRRGRALLIEKLKEEGYDCEFV